MNPIYLLLLSTLLLFQSPRSIQAISLSRLCGRFGHSCYGANWGKRELPEYLLSDMEKNNNAMSINENLSNHLKELRLKFLRHRLRRILKHE